MTAPIIVDWGSSNLRAYRFAGGALVEERRAEAGILAIADGAFEPALRAAIGDWLTPTSAVWLSGMIASRNGWVETPYAFAPATLADLAARIVERRLGDGVRLRFMPGVASAPPAPDVMRGEEIQAFGAVEDTDEATVVLPGTHSKWAAMERGRIAGFQSMMTGEMFAVLTKHSILGRLIDPAGPVAGDGFARGVRLALGDAPGGFLHHIFTARAAALLGALAAGDIADYLSGIVIGHEVREGLRGSPPGRRILVVGDEALVARYLDAFAIAGVAAERGDPRATIAGFAKLAALGAG
jgi:2-dehydro-3-deoxygalactonokinase